MRKENYLFEATREKAVREAQAVVDFMVAGKVKVYCEWCEETNAWYMVCYGYIYGRSLYIDAQPSSSAASTYSFRTHCLIE